MSTAPTVLSQTGENVLQQLYKSVYVPVDNSAHSNRAVELSLNLGETFGARLTGCHVYAARMHDYRFKQMEYTLPDEYLQEQELERQRKIHDSLITMGLELISDCYLEDMAGRCREREIEFESKMFDGKHSEELLKDIGASDYDLTILGAVGIGKTKDSQIGAVCERLVRNTDRDVWVVKDVPAQGEEERDLILVGIDGSPQSFGALSTALELARRYGKRVELIGVYDPYLHYAVFKGIVNVLTEKASKVFRFEEQNQLHEEIIDTGLAQIYQSHLNVAEQIARQEGVEVSSTLLDGKAFQKILDHARRVKPWLLVMGRVGVHSSPDEPHLGSNSENLLRLAPCDVLFTTRLEQPELDVKAEQSIHWTPEAEKRMLRVPDAVRNIARTAILRLAVEKGHSVITNSLVTEAMERFMPKRTSMATSTLAEKLAIEHARSLNLAMCRKCGVTAKTPDPVKCSVCGGTDFEVITPEMVERIAEAEGGRHEETAYDGRKVKWTKEARRALYRVEDKYQMRRSKARIEKKARMGGNQTITLEFAMGVIDEETGGRLLPPEAALVELPEETEVSTASSDEDIRVVATDAKGKALLSRYAWDEEAIGRIMRVPGGFMRDKTQERIEELAAQRAVEDIDLALVEDGIEIGRQMMAQMIGDYSAAKAEAAKTPAQSAPEERPASPAENKAEVSDVLNGQSPAAGGVPNEAGWMSDMVRRRKNIIDE